MELTGVVRRTEIMKPFGDDDAPYVEAIVKDMRGPGDTGAVMTFVWLSDEPVPRVGATLSIVVTEVED